MAREFITLDHAATLLEAERERAAPGALTRILQSLGFNFGTPAGEPVWTAMVMANSVLFRPGSTDAPAAIVYSFDTAFDADPDRLRGIAARLQELREIGSRGLSSDAPRELRAMAKQIEDEAARLTNHRVPASLVGGDEEVWYETLCIYRRDLPTGYLRDGLIPALALRSRRRTPRTLPLKYWPPELVAAWEDA